MLRVLTEGHLASLNSCEICIENILGQRYKADNVVEILTAIWPPFFAVLSKFGNSRDRTMSRFWS